MLVYGGAISQICHVARDFKAAVFSVWFHNVLSYRSCAYCASEEVLPQPQGYHLQSPFLWKFKYSCTLQLIRLVSSCGNLL